MRVALKFYHGSLGVPRGIGDDLDVARADPELGQELLHLLLLHPCLIMFMRNILIMIFFCDSILTSMVLLNISNMLMLLFSLSLPVVNTLKVHSENCCLGISIIDVIVVIFIVMKTCFEEYGPTWEASHRRHKATRCQCCLASSCLGTAWCDALREG